MRKNKLLLLLALLLTATTGAWAQEPATTYSVKMKDGTQDAKNWSIASGEKSAKGDAADGLTGLKEKDAVTLTYTGRLKVKGVTATSDEKPAEASVPDGAISGKFSVSDGKQVYFSKGNLRYASSKWSFFDNQYDYYTSHSADAWDHFGWSTSATTYGMSTSSNNDDYSGDFVDWGATMGAGWRTLTSDEWAYLLKTRSASTVNGTENGRYAKAKVNNVPGIILFPDTYTHPAGVEAPTGVNATDEYGWEGNSYTAADWTKMESAGCVFLPAAGCRYGSEMIGLGSYGYYGSATPDGADYAYRVKFNSGSLEPANSINRCLGCSVRLVQEATSEAAPAANIVDLATLTADYEAQDGDVLTGTLAGNYKISIADGATVTLDGVTINGVNDGNYEWAGITCLGDATIILSGTNTVKGFYEDYPGIQAAADKTLTINGTGSLTASSYGYGAGIGGKMNVACGNIEIQGGTITATSVNDGAGIGGGYKASCGNITISGGTVIAIGGEGGAGIGGAENASCGNITISGGTVTATGGWRGAGIGSGKRGTIGSCGNILISGGTVTATGGENAAGIGGGRGNNNKTLSSCGDITIANTVTKVTATAGENAPYSIGAGNLGTCGTVTIGGTKYWENNAAVNGGDTYLAQATIVYDPAAQAKPAATVTTAPTGAVIVGRLNTNSTALVSGGVADGGTLMYAVTTTNTMPTSTAGFSDAVPTAQSIKASGKVYVWYYVKGDDTHSDSEIAATAIEVPVADVVWDVTNVSDLQAFEGAPYEMDGVTMSSNAGNVFATWTDNGDPTYDGIEFQAYETGGFTFTAPAGKAFTKIEMIPQGPDGWDNANLGTGWAYAEDHVKKIYTVTWKGTAASTVNLLKDTDYFEGAYVKSIVFYLVE